GPEEETLHLGTGRLVEAADGGRHRRSGTSRARPDASDSAAGRSPGEERAGRDAARTPGLHESPRQPLIAAGSAWRVGCFILRREEPCKPIPASACVVSCATASTPPSTD